MAKLEHPTVLDYAIEAPIGVTVKGVVWSCIELPGAVELLGTRASVRVDATVDEISVANMGLMPTGEGQLMLSVDPGIHSAQIDPRFAFWVDLRGVDGGEGAGTGEQARRVGTVLYDQPHARNHLPELRQSLHDR